jgi:AraC-like DNA-binding protein
MTDSAYLDISREQIELNDNMKLTLFGRVTCESGWRGDWHQHDFWELVYVYKETTDDYSYTWQGGEFQGNESMLFLLPPKENHIFENTGTKEAQNIYIGFTFNYHSEDWASDLPVVLPSDHIAVAKTIQLLNEITVPVGDELVLMLNNKRTDVMRCVMDIIKWMTEKSGVKDRGLIDRNLMLIDTIKEYIKNNLDRYISVDELARQHYLSPNYLGQVFRQSTGMTVKNYHNQMRMEHALNILVSHTSSISEVADQLGFESVAYFSRRFKMFYGISPSSLYKTNKEGREGEE